MNLKLFALMSENSFKQVLTGCKIFSRILPLAEGQWQDCSVLFCARAQKVQNKGWRTTGKSGSVYY